jgi:hypothetical protein
MTAVLLHQHSTKRIPEADVAILVVVVHGHVAQVCAASSWMRPRTSVCNTFVNLYPRRNATCRSSTTAAVISRPTLPPDTQYVPCWL